MDSPMFTRKRPLFDGYEKQPPLYTKKCLASLKTLWDKYQTDTPDKSTQQVRLKTRCGHSCIIEACGNRKTNHLADTTSLPEQTSSWTDTQHSMKRVLEDLNSEQSTEHFYLNDSVNKTFLEFQHDITDECGTEDKQHSWAVLEKQEEIIMYGPYYPNYNNGEHSEDIVIKQTQGLLESEGVSEDWKVYIFTMNSPCLARNTNPCMLNLVHKAQEWWSVHGVRTYIGFIRCWGFKGNKENIFKDIIYRQMECINQSMDYESYVKAAEKILTDFKPLCETMFSVTKHLLRSGQVNKFPLITTVQKQDRKSYFKSMHTIFESKPEDEKKILSEEVNNMIEAVEVLLSEESESSEEYIKRGQEFALNYSFSSNICDALWDQMRLTFHQCWTEMVQDMYVEFIREKLTEDFNQRAVQLFIKDILKFTEKYLQIGKFQFSEEAVR